MANINLTTNSYGADKKMMSYNTGLILVAGLLVALVIGYIVIIIIDKGTQAKIAEADSQYMTEYQKLINNNKEVVDFQNRLMVAKDLVVQEGLGYSILPAVEKAMVPGIYLKALSYDQTQKTINLDGVADNFDMLAKQILSFKEADYFTKISAGSTSLDTNGKVNFSLKLIIK